MKRDELAVLGRRARSGDIEARNRIVDANRGLVGRVVKQAVRGRRWRTGTVGTDDLMQDGLISLMKAAQTWNPDEGARFSTYATRVISRDMYRVRLDSHLIRVPWTTHLLANHWRKMSRCHPAESDRQIGRRLGLSERRVRCILRAIEVEDGRAGLFNEEDEVEPWYMEDQFGDLVFQEDLSRLSACVGRLPDRLRNVVALRFGLDGCGEHMLWEVGASIGRTRSRAGQLEIEALRELGAMIAN